MGQKYTFVTREGIFDGVIETKLLFEYVCQNPHYGFLEEWKNNELKTYDYDEFCVNLFTTKYKNGTAVIVVHVPNDHPHAKLIYKYDLCKIPINDIIDRYSQNISFYFIEKMKTA
jgi:hypothetical protein